MVKDALQTVHGWDDVEIVTFRTSADRVTNRPVAELGGKALWTREWTRPCWTVTLMPACIR
jgi:hydroxymethylbilane synthase